MPRSHRGSLPGPVRVPRLSRVPPPPDPTHLPSEQLPGAQLDEYIRLGTRGGADRKFKPPFFLSGLSPPRLFGAVQAETRGGRGRSACLFLIRSRSGE
jgi:hypothetical protein